MCPLKVYDLLMLANKNLWRRKGRTLLTVLGMTIGTISIVVMVSLGIGLAEWQRKSMEQWGSLNNITVHPAFVHPEMPEEERQKLRLLNDDAIAEIKAMPGVLGVSPAFTVHGEAKKGREIGHLQITGIDPAMMDLLEFETMGGRLLNDTDRFNVVAGALAINNFMNMRAFDPNRWEQPPLRDPLELLDQRLTLTLQNGRQQKRRYTINVIGILDEQFMEQAYSIFAPLSVVRQMYSFINQGMQPTQFLAFEPGTTQQNQATTQRPKRQEVQYSSATVRAQDVEAAKRLSAELRMMGYQAQSMSDMLEGIEQGTQIVQAVLGGIGAISLLVAAIGIINTMVMSIYERTREIAVLKVLGASFSSIRWLFLAESSMIGFLGGATGLAFSYLLSMLINLYAGASIGAGAMGPGAPPVQISLIPLWLTAFSVVFGATIGLIAGLYPATRAMRLDPVTAMRHY